MYFFNTSKKIREYILGEATKFVYFESALDYIKHTFLTNNKFKFLVIISTIFVLASIIYFFKEKFSAGAFVGYVFGAIILYSLYLSERSAHGARKSPYPDIGFFDLVKPGNKYANLVTLWMKSRLIKDNDNEVHIDDVLGEFRRNKRTDLDQTSKEVKIMHMYRLEQNERDVQRFREEKEKERRIKQEKKKQKRIEQLRHPKRIKADESTDDEMGEEDTDEESYNEDIDEQYYDYGDNESGEVQAETTKKKFYLEKIRKLIRRKKNYESRYEYFLTDIKPAKEQLDKFFEQLQANFIEFMSESQKIKDVLIGIDVYLEDYLFEMEKVKDCIYRKFYLFDKQEEKENVKFIKVKKEDINPEQTHTQNVGHFTKEPVKEVIKESGLVNKLRDFYKNMFNQEKQIEKHQTKPIDDDIYSMEIFLLWLNYFFIVQGLCAFMLLLLSLTKFITIEFYCRITIISFLIIDIYLAIFMLLMAQVYDKKCITKNITTCNKERKLTTDETVVQITQTLELDEDTFDSIENIRKELARLAKEFGKKANGFHTYIVRNTYNKMFDTLTILNALLAKIEYLENNFDELTKGKVSKKEYFFIIHRMEILFESMLAAFNKPKVGSVLNFYRQALTLQVEFDREKENFINMIQDFTIDDAVKLKNIKESVCQKDLEKACNGRDIFDELYLTIFILAPIFIITLCN